MSPPLLRVAGRSFAVDRTLVMGVVNASPESFSGDGRPTTLDDQLRLVDELVAAGADIIDVGGQSARTNEPELDAARERDRVEPLVRAIVERHPGLLISVDAYRPAVVEPCLEAGARIVNDVSGLRHREVAQLCRDHASALVVMHTAAAPKVRRQSADLYGDVVGDVVDFLRRKVDDAVDAGMPRESVVVDPGPDFTKTPYQTVALLRGLDEVRALERPVLLAVSRKDFIGAVVERPPRGRDAGTTAALAVLAAGRSGLIARVHDVAAARDAIAVADVLTGRRELDPSYVLPDDLRYEPRNPPGR